MNRLFAAPVAIGALLLLLAAAAGLGWIWLRAGRPEHLDPWNISVLLIPVVLLVAAVLTWGTTRTQIAISVWGVLLLGGFLPLIFALHAGEAGTPGSATSRALTRSGAELTAQQRARLFDGAVSEKTTDNAGRAESLRIGMLEDGSVLLLFHFHSNQHATDQVTMLAQSHAGSTRVLQTLEGLTLEANQQFHHLRQYAGDVLSLTASDPAALQTRVREWQLPPPAEISSRGANDGSRSDVSGAKQWPFAVGYGVSWIVLLLGFLVWLAPWAARVLPPPQILPVAEQTLRNRLLALHEIAPTLQFEPGDRADEFLILYVFRAGTRRVEMRLRLDSENKRVIAKEYIGVKGDAPITESEAQMRFMRNSGGRVSPPTNLVFSADWAVTLPMEEKRHSLGV